MSVFEINMLYSSNATKSSQNSIKIEDICFISVTEKKILFGPFLVTQLKLWLIVRWGRVVLRDKCPGAVS